MEKVAILYVCTQKPSISQAVSVIVTNLPTTFNLKHRSVLITNLFWESISLHVTGDYPHIGSSSRASGTSPHGGHASMNQHSIADCFLPLFLVPPLKKTQSHIRTPLCIVSTIASCTYGNLRKMGCHLTC